MDKMVTRMIELRRGKMDEAACRKALQQTNYFGTMLVQMGYADGLLGGATYSTADTVRPALQLVKAAPGNSIVSSCFVLVKGEEQLVMGDCSININPNVDELVEITMQTANTVKQLGMTPRIGLLSYSTLGSAKGESVSKVREAAIRLSRMPLDYKVEGEMQFDCCVAAGGRCAEGAGIRDRRKHQHVHLPEHRCRKHRLQDRCPPGRMGSHRTDPAGTECADQ